jgi:hypothetical protein
MLLFQYSIALFLKQIILSTEEYRIKKNINPIRSAPYHCLSLIHKILCRAIIIEGKPETAALM